MPTWARILIWVLVISAGIALVVVLGRTLVPFIVGAGMAFIFDPLTGWLARKGIRRGWAALLVTLVTFGVLAGCLAMLLPVLLEQASDFAERLPDLLTKARIMLTGATAQVPGAEVFRTRTCCARWRKGRASGFSNRPATCWASPPRCSTSACCWC